MNARQKAKYYKKKYEELVNMSLPNFTVETKHVETLRASRVFSGELGELSIGMEQQLRKNLVMDLCEGLESYVDFYTEPCTISDYSGPCGRYTAEIKVV